VGKRIDGRDGEGGVPEAILGRWQSRKVVAAVSLLNIDSGYVTTYRKIDSALGILIFRLSTRI